MSDRTDIDRKFEPVTREDVDDISLLPGEFRAFRAEMRQAFALLTTQLLPLIKRANEEIDDLKERVSANEQRIAALEDRGKRKR